MSSIAEATLFGLLAGLVTVVGGAIGTSIKKPSPRVLSATFGFTAGAMLTVTFVNIIPEALKLSMLMALEGFVLGVICLMIVDIKLPHVHVEEAGPKRLVRIGTLIAIGIFIHDLPEGLAIGSGYMVPVIGPSFGLFLALAIALHNAPEGFSIAVPLFAGGVSKSRIVLATLIVGLPTALGAFLGGCIGYISPELIAGALGFAGGAMLYITSDELIPEAQRRGHGHAASAGLTLGTICILVASQLIP